MGNLFKSRSEVVQDPGAAQAWGIAAPTFGYVNPTAVNFTQGVMQNPAYTGQRVAGLNPFQTNSANSLGTFATGMGDRGASALTDTGLRGLSAFDQFSSNAGNIFGRSAMDPTQQILANANQYANNPYIDGQIDAAGRDVVRQLTEQALPSLNRQFSGTGNTNSTRAGVESAIAQRGAADRLADISSNIRSQFFGQGLGMAQNQYNTNLQNQLAANQQLLAAGQQGANNLLSGQQYAGNNFNLGQSAGGVFQNQNQNELNANKAVFDESFANRLAALQALAGIGNATQAKTAAGVASQPSIMSQIAAVGQSAAQAYRAM